MGETGEHKIIEYLKDMQPIIDIGGSNPSISFGLRKCGVDQYTVVNTDASLIKKWVEFGEDISIEEHKNGKPETVYDAHGMPLFIVCDGFRLDRYFNKASVNAIVSRFTFPILFAQETSDCGYKYSNNIFSLMIKQFDSVLAPWNGGNKGMVRLYPVNSQYISVFSKEILNNYFTQSKRMDLLETNEVFVLYHYVRKKEDESGSIMFTP